MIIKNSKNNGSAKGAVSYVLSDFDSNRNKREIKPVVIKGEPNLTIEIDNNFFSNFAENQRTISGVISFRDDEKPTEKEINKIIDYFENTFFSNMKNRVNILWVRHEDKKPQNTELHYVVNLIDLETGKKYNPFWPPGTAWKLMAGFSAIINDNLGYAQVEKDPLKTRYSNDEYKCLKKSNKENGFKNLKEKHLIDKALNYLVRSGEIKNRTELIQFLKDNNKNITRVNDNFISIENKDGKNIRLKDGIYAFNNGADYKEIIQKAKDKSQFNVSDAISKLNIEILKRNEYNNKRYKADISKPFALTSSKAIQSKVNTVKPLDTPKAQDTGKQTVSRGQGAASSSNATQSHAPTEKTAQNPVKSSQAQPTQPKNSTHQGSTGANRSSVTTGKPFKGSSIGNIGASANVERLKALLANCKDMNESISLQYQLAIAIAEMNKQLITQEDIRKKSINKLK